MRKRAATSSSDKSAQGDQSATAKLSEKQEQRMLRNRESARLSRQRRSELLNDLKAQNLALKAEKIAISKDKLALSRDKLALTMENIQLKAQLNALQKLDSRLFAVANSTQNALTKENAQLAKRVSELEFREGLLEEVKVMLLASKRQQGEYTNLSQSSELFPELSALAPPLVGFEDFALLPNEEEPGSDIADLEVRP